MPHIIVKMHPGRDEETKKILTQKIEELLIEVLHTTEDAVSISIEEINSDDWRKKVVEPDIINKRGTITKMPGYKI